jgi:hypothetical protein
VHAVVHAPRGAAPSSCHPFYPFDGEAILDYTEAVGDEQGFWRYVEREMRKA